MAEGAKTWRRVLGLALGIALIAAAIWYAAARVDFTLIQQAKPWQLAAIAGGVVLNLLVTSLLFWVVTLPFKPSPPVSYRKMLALISASGLLNYLPLQAGTVGRSAYLVRWHGLSVRDAAVIVADVLAITILIAAVFTLPAGGLAGGLSPWIAWPLVALFLIMGGFVLTACFPGGDFTTVRHAVFCALAIKMFDLIITAGRLWLGFRVVGHPVSAADALIAASASTIASVVSPIPNGLGLREWAVALTQGPYGVAATLVDRAVEAVVLVVAGVFGIAKLKSAKPQAASIRGAS